MKRFDIGFVKMNMETNGFPKGLILKRELNLRECKYIMTKLLGIVINDRDCFEDKWEYDEYNNGLVSDVNKWLKGDIYDDYFMQEYGGDCADEAIGIMNLIPILSYLKKNNIID